MCPIRYHGSFGQRFQKDNTLDVHQVTHRLLLFIFETILKSKPVIFTQILERVCICESVSVNMYIYIFFTFSVHIAKKEKNTKNNYSTVG